MYVQQFFVEGLGCASYLIGCEACGTGAVIDPDRDVEPYLESARLQSLKIEYIIETHLHADHVSGNTELARQTGAAIYLHESAAAEFPHLPLRSGDTIQMENVRLEVRHTPGHTPESITLLATDTIRSSEPFLAFTGDTLFAGDVGRPDLVGPQAAQRLAGQMYNSLRDQILVLEDNLQVYPGHGSGSLCGRSMRPERSTNLGFERQNNPALATRSLAEFVQFATQDLPEQPGNHQWIKNINRRGPTLLSAVASKPLSIREAVLLFQRGAALIDTRPRSSYTKKHIPGSVHLEADSQLSNRIGFILPPDLSIVLLLEDLDLYRTVFYSLARVGFEKVAGYLAEDLEQWEAAGLPTASGDIQDITPNELNAMLISDEIDQPVVVDVREPWEFHQGHIPGAILIPMGELPHRAGELDPDYPTVLICATGVRSQSAAALLGQRNFRKLFNVRDGTMGWIRSGLPVER
jgi:glyoxylase-like metal-dependent hydrolase (beta-lactamase superfamily II)/rhodanese-related sulfurtransferase